MTALSPDDIARLFTAPDGSYAFARWGRPIAPVVFGVDDRTLATVKGAIEAVVAFADHRMIEHDPELAANFMVFFLRDWSELADTPALENILPGIGKLGARMQEADANQYRVFRFDDNGAIMMAFTFLRMDDDLSAMSAESLALGQVVQAILRWSDTAFSDRSPLAIANGQTILRPEIAEVIRAAYDPVLPAAANDPSHALRLYARLGQAPKSDG